MDTKLYNALVIWLFGLSAGLDFDQKTQHFRVKFYTSEDVAIQACYVGMTEEEFGEEDEIIKLKDHAPIFRYQYFLLKDYIDTPLPTCYEYIDIMTKHGKNTVLFSTRADPVFDQFVTMVLDKREDGLGYRKVIPGNIQDFLTPHSLAILWMELGILSEKAKPFEGVNGPAYAHFQTQFYRDSDIHRLKSAIEDKFKLICHLQDGKIYLDNNSYKSFEEIVLPHLVPFYTKGMTEGWDAKIFDVFRNEELYFLITNFKKE